MFFIEISEKEGKIRGFGGDFWGNFEKLRGKNQK